MNLISPPSHCNLFSQEEGGYSGGTAGPGHLSNPDSHMDQGKPLCCGQLRAVGPVPGSAVVTHPLGGVDQGVVQDHGDSDKSACKAGVLS